MRCTFSSGYGYETSSDTIIYLDLIVADWRASIVWLSIGNSNDITWSSRGVPNWSARGLTWNTSYCDWGWSRSDCISSFVLSLNLELYLLSSRHSWQIGYCEVIQAWLIVHLRCMHFSIWTAISVISENRIASDRTSSIVTRFNPSKFNSRKCN